MSKMHNLGTVVKFETIRTLKKVSFWAMALGFPIMIALLYCIAFWSNQATIEASKKLQEQKFSIMVTDVSKTIKPEMLNAIKAQQPASKDAGVAAVRDGKIDAYFYFPADLSHQKVELYAKDVGLFENGKYGGVADTLLQESAAAGVTSTQKAILQNHVKKSTTTYRDGKEHDNIKELIAPAFFLVLFYMLVSFFGNQMLTSTVEEKENRTVEMLLTTVQAKTLIVGKIWALITLSLIQGMIIVLPVLVGYLLFGHQLQLPNFDLSQIVFDPTRIAVAIALFGASFMMLTGLLVTVGAMMPTAKEASSWVGLVMILLFGPLYGGSVFISYPESTFSMAMSYFPLTAPIPLMLRNTVGNLSLIEALIGVAVLVVSAVLIMMLAVRVFRYGAMSYDSKLSLSALRMKRKTS